MDDVAHSNFHQMPDDNFYDLQEDWKLEIDEMLIEIREKEKVSSEWQARETGKCLHTVQLNYVPSPSPLKLLG